MATRKAIVLVGGRLRMLAAGDSLDNVVSSINGKVGGVVLDRFDGAFGFNTPPDLSEGLVSIKANSVANPTPALEVWADNGTTQANISVTTYGVNGGGIMHVRSARGTKAAPLPVLSGDIYGGIGGRPYHSGGDFFASSPVSLHWVAKEDQQPTSKGGCFRILTTSVGSSDRKVSVVIADDGDLVVGKYDNSPLEFSRGRGLAIIREGSASGAEASVQCFGNVGANTAGFRSVVAGGSVAAPAATSALMGTYFGLSGHNGGAFTGSAALLGMEAEANWSATSSPAAAFIETCPTGSSARVRRMHVTGAGDVGFGTSTPNLQSTTDLNVSLSAAVTGDRLARLNLQGSRSSASAFCAVQMFHRADPVIQLAGLRGASGVAGGTFYVSTKRNDSGLGIAISVTENKNLNIGADATDNGHNGQGVIFLQNASVVPTTNPVGGGVLYFTNNSLYCRAANGKTTQITTP